MFRRFLLSCAALAWLLGAAPRPSPTPEPAPNAEAERYFARAKAAWHARIDVRYVRYGALVRYLHNGHVFDNWWDAYYRSSDGALALHRLVDMDEDRARLRGVPFSIFGVKIFDTNPDSEPIRLDEPRIEPSSSFGILGRAPAPVPSAVPRLSASAAPDLSDAAQLRQIGRVEASVRDYDIELAGTERVMGLAAVHLTLTPLRDPKVNRLRDMWLDPVSYRTVQLNVQGLLNGQPYDGIEWTVRYVLVDGRQYVQQIVATAPLRFGLDTVLPKFEFDFVDFHFPTDVPKFTFDRLF